MIKDNSSSTNELEEGVKIESNPEDSEKKNKKFQEGEISDSDSKIKEIDTELEKKDQERQNFESATNNKNDTRRIIKLEPDSESENLEESDTKEGDDQLVFEEEKSEDTVSESSEKQEDFTETEFHDKKELDAQIKENNNLIRKLEEKVASISEDMNDLIGLYEIVSGQMNPFVGLSKVTKKRLDVLENFDKEMESLKTRLESIESLVGRIDISKSSSKNISPMDDIDDIIDRALELVLDKNKIDDIIERAIENLNIGDLSPNNMGGE